MTELAGESLAVPAYTALMSRAASVVVEPVPSWMDAPRLFGTTAFVEGPEGRWTATLPRAEAADVAARLRGLGFDGSPVVVSVSPPLSRDEVRAARTIDARRRRDTTPLSSLKGLRLDAEGKMSWTPEALANALASRFPADNVLDAGCGAGSCSIAYAKTGARVVAVESSTERLADARFNATLAGVAKRIRFVEGDAMDAVVAPTESLVLVDPPWGAEWDRTRTSMDALPLLARALVAWRSKKSWTLVAKVPSSFDTRDLGVNLVVPFFGQGAGDFGRVKFLACAWFRASENA